MKAICKDNSRTWRERLTIGKEYDVLKHYIDNYNTEIIELNCDNGDHGVYTADRFDLIHK